jgi:phosphoribosyl 1,2-cyclic phosphodiesterase
MLVESSSTLLMVDCGLSVKAVEKRLGVLGRHPRDVDALLVTHEHSDHIQGVARFAARHGTPVWMTPGTASSSAARKLTQINTFNYHRELKIGAIDVQPFPVPHDAREPSQFVFRAGDRKLGILTDTGHITAHICERLEGCDALALECNHDLDTLWSGAYPEHLKARVASSLGHLNNSQTADLLGAVGHRELQWVVALHLSEKNNSPDLVHKSLVERLDHPRQSLHVATQDEPSGWIAID